jgi:AcrR family transcriptional regulator
MPKYSTSDTTKQKIIQATGELAAEAGFVHVTTRMVADRSGENIGSIHYHFGGKEGLFKAVVREAIQDCIDQEYISDIGELRETATPEELSRVLRAIVAGEIRTLFCSGRPSWHFQVIYQLLQRDDALYELVRKELLEPEMQVMEKFFRRVKPAITDEEIFLHTILLKMPIFSHVDYMKTMLKWLNTEQYSEAYLQHLEDMLVKQSQLLLDLPLDK